VRYGIETLLICW